MGKTGRGGRPQQQAGRAWAREASLLAASGRFLWRPEEKSRSSNLAQQLQCQPRSLEQKEGKRFTDTGQTELALLTVA